MLSAVTQRYRNFAKTLQRDLTSAGVQAAAAYLAAAEQQLKSVRRLRHRLSLPAVKQNIEAAFELAQAAFRAMSGQLAEASTAYSHLLAASPQVLHRHIQHGYVPGQEARSDACTAGS